MTIRTTSRLTRAALAIAALVPITIATTVGAAYATDEPQTDPAPIVEIAEQPSPPEQPELPAQQAPAAPEPEGLASTNDPQDPEDPVAPTARASYPAKPEGSYTGWHDAAVPVTLSGTASQPASIDQIVWNLTGAMTASGSDTGPSTTVTISAEGTTTLDYYVTDSEGLASDTQTLVFKVDSIAPTVSMTSPAEGAVFVAGDTVSVDFECVETYLWFCSMEFLKTGQKVNSGDVVTLTEGVQTVRVEALDLGGHRVSIDHEITVLAAEVPDTTPPVVTIEQTQPVPASGWWNKAVEVDFTATDSNPIQSLEYRPALEGGGWGSWAVLAANPGGASTLTGAMQFFASGEYVYQFRATDSLGNVSEPIEYAHNVDKEVSGATVSGFPSHFALGEAYELYYTCADALSGVASCESSNGASGALLPTDVEGEHSFTLTNTDVAGNSKTTTWTYTVGDDTTVPTVSVESPASGWVSSGDVDVTFRATDDSSGIAQLWVQAEGAEPLSGRFVDGASYVFTARAEGVTTFTTYAIDAAGNQSAPQTYTVSIDRTPPTVEISKPANRTDSLVATKTFTQGAVVELAFACADTLSGVASCEAAQGDGSTLPTAEVGDHSIDIVAVDRAGNTSTRTLEYTVAAAPVGPVKPTPVVSGLASTGVEIWALLLFVAALLAAGASLLAVSRARR